MLSLGQYHCPVLYSVFTDNTHIVAIRTTGNVYTYEVDLRFCEWYCLMLGPQVCCGNIPTAWLSAGGEPGTVSIPVLMGLLAPAQDITSC